MPDLAVDEAPARRFGLQLLLRDGTDRGTCETVGHPGHDHVRLEIGCRGPHLLTRLLQVVIDDHASAQPRVHLQAKLEVDDSMRPRRIDLLLPQWESPRGRTLPGRLALAQPV